MSFEINQPKKRSTNFYFSFLGNALEFYDFTVYGVFAAVFANLYFPMSHPWLPLVASWGVFAAAFFMRPLGALVFGYFGDRLGRRYALMGSVFTMGLATLGIGFLPDFSSIGILAPILLIFFRCLQGLSTGGEYNGSAIFAIEQFGKNSPGLISGIMTSSCVVGALLGTGISHVCLSYLSSNIAWRVPFIFGGMAGFVLFFLRKNLLENYPIRKEALDSVFVFIKGSPLQFASNIFLGVLNGCFSYILFGFSILYISRYLGYPSSFAMMVSMTGLLSYLLFSVVMGWAYDRVSVSKYFSAAVAVILLLLPVVFSTIQMQNQMLIPCAFFLLGICGASIAGPAHAYLQESVPQHFRYRVVSTSFSVGIAIGGGLTPVLMTYLIETYRNLYFPSYWLMTITTIFFVSLLLDKKRFSNERKSSPTVIQDVV